MDKTSIGDRMKEFYENRTRIYLPRRTYTIIRVDGKAFHTYTKGLKTPFDDAFMDDMDETACYMCKNIQGAKFAFVQSDEISILLTDFDDIKTDAWYDGNIQKITSISASLATAKFNDLRFKTLLNSYKHSDAQLQDTFEDHRLAMFDSRCFTIPSAIEVENYFIWRQQDTERNSILSVAQSLYSHKKLHGKKGNDMQEMCFQKGVNWNDFAPKYKRGRFIMKEQYEKEGATRNRWVSVEPPIFTQNRKYFGLDNMIPV